MTPIKQYIIEHYDGDHKQFAANVKPQPVLLPQVSRWIKLGMHVTAEGYIINPKHAQSVTKGDHHV